MATITALFADKESAERAFQFALTLGYESSDITVAMSSETREKYFPSPAASATELEVRAVTGKDQSSGDKLGGPVGGTIGTLAPVIAAVGAAVLIPGLGIVAGPLAAALTAAGAVGIASGVLGILANWGVPAPRLKEYEAGIKAGGILLGVKTKSAEDAQNIQQQWQAYGGLYIHA